MVSHDESLRRRRMVVARQKLVGSSASRHPIRSRSGKFLRRIVPRAGSSVAATRATRWPAARRRGRSLLDRRRHFDRRRRRGDLRVGTGRPAAASHAHGCRTAQVPLDPWTLDLINSANVQSQWVKMIYIGGQVQARVDVPIAMVDVDVLGALLRAVPQIVQQVGNAIDRST